MNIIVCIKQVVATDLQLELDANKVLDPDDLIIIPNPYDLVAVEESVRIKEKLENGSVKLISVGPPSAKDMLQRCLAMGADEAIHLWDRIFENSDPWATALILARKIEKMDFDLILCGRKSTDENNGQVGTYIAELLGVPHVYAITKLEIDISRKVAKVHRAREGGDREVVVCPIPAVFSVDMELNQPRYPSFPQYLSALKKEIVTLGAKPLGISRSQVGRAGSLTKVAQLSMPGPRSSKLVKVDSNLSAEERLNVLMTGGISEKSGGVILDGEPEAIAKKFVDILQQQGMF
jgi:electron transfer flavoprotein beta subunit